jgi:hypothetical protein
MKLHDREANAGVANSSDGVTASNRTVEIRGYGWLEHVGCVPVVSLEARSACVVGIDSPHPAQQPAPGRCSEGESRSFGHSNQSLSKITGLEQIIGSAHAAGPRDDLR